MPSHAFHPCRRCGKPVVGELPCHHCDAPRTSECVLTVLTEGRTGLPGGPSGWASRWVLDPLARLLRASAWRDQETCAHLCRVGFLSEALAVRLGLAEQTGVIVRLAAPLHDVGKIAISDDIVRKKGPLDDYERLQMERHTLIGAELLGDSPSLLVQSAHEIALSHHERWDGSGYPYGLAGDAIPLFARIVALADVYDALRSKRPYKRAFSHDEACEVILRGDERTRPEHFDPALLDAFAGLGGVLEAVCARFPDDAPALRPRPSRRRALRAPTPEGTQTSRPRLPTERTAAPAGVGEVRTHRACRRRVLRPQPPKPPAMLLRSGGRCGSRSVPFR